MSIAEVDIVKAHCCLSSLLILISAISTYHHLFCLTVQGRSVITSHVLVYLSTLYSADTWLGYDSISLELGHHCWGHILVK